MSAFMYGNKHQLHREALALWVLLDLALCVSLHLIVHFCPMYYHL